MPIPNVTAPADTGRIRQAIASAANRTGVDFDYLYNQARIESSLDPSARARTSSATGLFQFTRQTWLSVLKTHGANHGLGWAANAIERSGSGFTVNDPSLRAAIDNLRFDPEASAAMAAEFAADNGAHLESVLGREAEPVDLYLAHFLGSGGATRFLNAFVIDPSTPAAPLLPQAAAANRTIFYSPEGQARSVGEIRASFAAKLDDAAPPPSAMSSVASPRWAAIRRNAATGNAPAPLEMASIEPMPRNLSLDFAARAYRRLSGVGA